MPSELVEGSLGGVGRAILIGAFLVVAVLLALLGDWRAALIVTLTLPLSILLAGLLLKPANIGINTMTLGLDKISTLSRVVKAFEKGIQKRDLKEIEKTVSEDIVVFENEHRNDGWRDFRDKPF